MKTISINVPEAFLEDIQVLIKQGYYANRSECIRHYINVEVRFDFLFLANELETHALAEGGNGGAK